MLAEPWMTRTASRKVVTIMSGHQKVARIYDNVRKVISIAKREGVPTYRAADVMVEERLERIRKIKRIGKSW
jgi:hypothetical protein